jgi:glycerate-2-kinase
MIHSDIYNKALTIFQQAISVVQPENLFKNIFLQSYASLLINNKIIPCNESKIYVLAIGKAAAAMALSVEEQLGNMIAAGLVVTKYGHALPLRHFTVIESGHPVPDEQSVRAAEAIIQFAKSVTANDCVFVLLSGGASALVADLPNNITLSDVQKTFQLLLNCGAAIHEMNTVRKHISTLKGGNLAKLLMPATVLTLAISDVLNDDSSVIGSGLTVPDASTYADAWGILQRYHLLSKVPSAIYEHLQKGLNGEIPDTPKISENCFNKTSFVILANNGMALQSAKQAAEKMGFYAKIVSSQLQGEAKEVAKNNVKYAENYTGIKPACFLWGGETTVTIKGNGLGGRNQELVLAAGLALPSHLNAFVLAIGTDGTDGPTDAAGAFTNYEQMQLAKQMGLKPDLFLNKNDAYHFFEQVNGLIKTGPTQTNVMDIVMVFIH